MGAFVAVVPLVIEGLQLAETLWPSIVKGVQLAKQAIPKHPDKPMTAVEVTAAQTIALQKAKTEATPIAVATNTPLPGDETLSKAIELFYQVDKAFIANPITATNTAKINTEYISPTLALVEPLFQLFQQILTETKSVSLTK